jgi:hypothetical protein
MRKLTLISFALLFMVFSASAQIQGTIPNVCFNAPYVGDTTTITIPVSLSGNNDTVGSASFILSTDSIFWFSNVFLHDSNYSAAIITYNGDTLRFNWNGGGFYNIVGADSILLDITLSTVLTLADTINWSYPFFIDNHGSQITTINNDGYLNPTPEITKDPDDITVCNGNQTYFSIEANGFGYLLNYNWQLTPDTNLTWQQIQNISPFAGAYTDSLIVNPADITLNGNFFHCLVDNGSCPVVNSGIALLTILSNVLTQPADQTIYENDTAIFAVTSGSLTPQYLWEVSIDGGILWSSTQLFPPITTPILTIINPPLSWSGYLFRCVVSGDCSPADTTEEALLTVLSGSSIAEFGNIRASIFPNPMNRTAEFNSSLNEAYNLEMIDITGRSITKWTNLNSIFIIEKGKTDNGIYFLIATGSQSGRKAICRFIIQ